MGIHPQLSLQSIPLIFQQDQDQDQSMAAELCNAVVSGVASKVAESLFDPIRREISYVFKYQIYVEKLRSQLLDLKNKKQRLDQTVNEAKRQGGKIYDDVQQWLDQTTILIERADKLINEDEDVAKSERCFKGLCPNLMSRRKLSKEAVNAGNVATDLLTKGNFSNVYYLPAPERTELVYDDRGYQQFDSRMKIFQDVLEVLKDDKVGMIGVYGMGGVGKTTLVKQVAKKVVEEKLLFDEVAMVEVTLNPDLKTIQDKIAYDLGLTFLQNESTLYARADRLRQRLKEEKRVLVILDNIWAKLDLEAVGIPSGVHDHRQCTILLTSRRQHVLCNDMNAQKTFSIEVLSDEESVGLFWKTVGDDLTQRSDFQPLAVAIVGKCGGLPIAIKTIGNAMKNKEPPVWKDTLNKLRNFNPKDIPGMGKDVYSTVKLSYDLLEIEEAKSLFLLCALQNDGSQIPIDDLTRYGMGLGWFKKVYTMEEGRNRVHTLIENLKTSSLLLDGDGKDVVKMHDVIHDVAVSIATDELMFNIQNVADLKKALENTMQKDPTAISIHSGNTQELPERLECPKLELFLLFAKYDSSLPFSKVFFEGTKSSLPIPDLFFERTKALKVLHLTEIRWPVLPSSLGCLINLETLTLVNWNLGNVAVVGELKKLEILSFKNSDITQLPLEIGQLMRLKLLDLSNCWSLKEIAPNVISKLSRLEELYMGNSFTQWEKDGGGTNASLVELKTLPKLTTLEIDIPNAIVIPQDLFSVELERYKICVGGERNYWTDSESLRKFESDSERLRKCERILKLKGLDKRNILGSGMKKLLKNIEYLRLNELNGFQNVVNELYDREVFQQLKDLIVENDSEIVYIVNSVGQIAFPLLESLFLHNLINLEKVCQGQLTVDQSFSKLRMIDAQGCHGLKHLFSLSMAQNCFRLQKIQVTNCKNLKLIVGEESENHTVRENGSIIFPQLHSLTLGNLPQLTSSGFDREISRTISATPSASKEIVAEDDREDSMTVLFNNKIIFPMLEKLQLYSLNIANIWLDHFSTLSTSPCQNLTELTVRNCSHMEFLFSYSMAKSLLRLQRLVIQSCESMERIIDTTGLGRDEEQMIESLVFPKLLYLKLKKLQKLTRFVSLSSSDSEENNILYSSTQPALFNEKVRFPSLEQLEIRKMENLRKIWQWPHQLTWDSFSKLNTLAISNCDKLTSVFSSNIIMGRRFETLETLMVESCGSIEDIIEEETSSSSNSSSRKFDVFPRLINLKLWRLPKLRNIYQGIHVLKWPALEYLCVWKCDKIEILFASSEISKLLENQQPIILIDNQKVVFPNLKTLKVEECNDLRNLMTLSIAESQVKLARMEIFSCKMIEKIIEMQVGGVKEDPIVFSQLEYLKLDTLPRLESFCLENYTLEFPNLEQVVVSGCPSMKIFSQGALDTPKLHVVQLTKEEERWEGNLNSTIQKLCQGMDRFYGIKYLKLSEFPILKEIWYGPELAASFFSSFRSLVVDDLMFMLSTAIPANLLRFLNNLNKLEVRNCHLVEEVFHLEDLNANEVKVPPLLTTLKLVDLPKLKRFCNSTGNRITLKWLLSLWIENCPNMETFVSNYTLEHMTTTKESQEMTSEDSILTDIQPLFDEKVAFPNLLELKLSKLPKLFHLLKENSHPINVFAMLQRLEISECHKLRQLVPSSLTFENLTTLEVSECEGLINLMTLSTVKNLARLTRMNINDCKMIEEIIQQKVGEEVENNCIVFNKLQYLELSCLSSLTSFCLGNYTLEFPSLEYVFVKECPKMEIFSRGVLRIPKLRRLQLTELDSEEEWRWEGSLNFTIQKMFQEMNSKEENRASPTHP